MAPFKWWLATVWRYRDNIQWRDNWHARRSLAQRLTDELKFSRQWYRPPLHEVLRGREERQKRKLAQEKEIASQLQDIETYNIPIIADKSCHVCGNDNRIRLGCVNHFCNSNDWNPIVGYRYKCPDCGYYFYSGWIRYIHDDEKTND